MLAIGIVLFPTDNNDYHFLRRSIEEATTILASTHPGVKTAVLLKLSAPTTCPLVNSADYVDDNLDNVGFGRSHNRLMSHAFDTMGASLYFCLNHDTILDPHVLVEAYRHYQANKKNVLFEAIQTPMEHPKPYDPLSGETEWCSGAALFITRDVYLKTDGFDENIFMYCEDVDLSWRVRSYGGVCRVLSSARVYHESDVRGSKPREIRRHMLLAARYIGYKWRAPAFVDKMEENLIEEGYFPSRLYLPNLPRTLQEEHRADIVEFRQLLSFCIPRW